MKNRGKNLIKNSRWLPGPSGGPEFFAGAGPITYDRLSIGGCRTCSITMADGVAQDFYLPLIDVAGMPAIRYGFTIRVIDADHIAYAAEFYNRSKTPLRCEIRDITEGVNYSFRDVGACFDIPSDAAFVRLSIRFTGKITACTYWAPYACFA
ncbi:MAG: hypothetical protein P4L75_07810 [Clostridia bacterium]|nr:hypothetical protein [Clostridia bacterium]MDR3645721.1 hypothetical protein [Clostridia bacterium]